MDTKQILIKILEIIDYKDNIEKFADDFIKLCYDTTNVEMMQLLSKEDKKQFEEDLLALPDINQTPTVFGKYISPEKYKKHLEEVTEKLLMDYFQTIAPSLTEEQVEKLINFLPTS